MPEPTTIKINEVEYVRKDSISCTPKILGDYFIVRTSSAGVFAGNIVSREGMEVEMANARRLWYWDGAASLSQLALEGVKSPTNCKFPAELPKVVLTQAIEIIPCTDAARKSIAEVKVWERK
ncbi:MAG: hypothetical protein WC294_08145 [Methanoregula sp.]|jgi:hypothetical protein